MDEIQNGPSQQGAVAHSDSNITAKEGLLPKVNAPETQVNLSNDEEPPFRVPALTAIAGVLIRHWAEGRTEGISTHVQKGSL